MVQLQRVRLPALTTNGHTCSLLRVAATPAPAATSATYGSNVEGPDGLGDLKDIAARTPSSPTTTS